MKNKGEFKTTSDVWDSINKGHTVFYMNTSFKVYVEDSTTAPNRIFSDRNGKLLSVRCIGNQCGSAMRPGDIAELFILP